MAFLNETLPPQQERVDVRVINNYSKGAGCPERATSLMVISNPSQNRVCLPRLLSILTNQRMYLEVGVSPPVLDSFRWSPSPPTTSSCPSVTTTVSTTISSAASV